MSTQRLSFSATVCKNSIATAFLGIAVSLASPPGSGAATLTWSGGSATGSTWFDSANWGSVGTPSNGDTLVFPASQPRMTITNNIAGLTLNQIRFTGASGGYNIYGNAITLTNSIFATNSAGANVLSNNITLASSGDFYVEVATGAKLTLGGTLSGAVGLVKGGGGTNKLSGGFDNVYSGTTTVTNGWLELFKAGASAKAIPHDLVIGKGAIACTVRNFAGSEIADSGSVTVNRLSTWDLDGRNETISALTLSGGSVTTDTGQLTLSSNITSVASINTASISGTLSLGGATRTISVGSGSAAPDLLISANIIEGSASAGLIKTGIGQLTLSGSNNFTGMFTVDGFVILADDHALGASGSPTNGTTVNANGFLLVQGVNIGNEFLTLADNTDFRSSGTASWAGPITLNGDVFINVFGGTFTNSGSITGTGGITKGQAGTLIYAGSGANIYSGDTVVNIGELQLAKTIATAGIVNSALTIGDDLGGADADIVREMGANQINSSVPIRINSSGLLDLNNFSDAIGAVVFSGGHLSSGTGTATLTGNITAIANTNAQAVIDGKVSISGTRTFDITNHFFSPDLKVNALISGAGGITKNGTGELGLSVSNSYTGLTTVNAGFLEVDDSFALGSTNTGAIVNPGGVLALRFGVHVGLEPLTVSGPGISNVFGALSGSFGSNSWNGAITLGSNTTFSVINTTDFLDLNGPIGGTGDVTKIGPGTFIMSGNTANTYSGNTYFNEGTNRLSKSVTDGAVPHDLFVGDGVGGAVSDVVQIIGRAQIATVSEVTIATSGLLDLNEISEGIGTLSGFGRVDLGSTGTGALILNGNGSTTYSGLIVGAGGNVTKRGTGTFTLTGANTYSGRTAIEVGTLIVNGSQPASPVAISAAGTLGGSGIVGNLTNILGGSVAPGSSTATLTSSNVTFSGVSSDFTVELNGDTAGMGYDQLNVRGTVALGGATLNVVPNFTALNAPTNGTVFTIINNDGVEAISGTFSGLADGASLTVGGLQFRINYTGVFANDVILTLTNVAAGFASVTVKSGNGDAIVQPNECNLLNVAITNFAAGSVTGISATLLSATPNIAVVQGASAYPNLPVAGRSTNSTPFQISISPSFVCGQNIALLLVVATGNAGTFSIPFTLNTGAPLSGLIFGNNNVKLIPDGSSTNSTVTVSGITAPIAKVTVSLNINHGSDGDLDLFLQSPDGTVVELSTDNGGSGNNYGNSCAQQTTFDDNAGTAITAGTAPFFGIFRPEGALNSFRGLSGVSVNGTWTLLVNDDTVNAIAGELDCWSLNLFPAFCAAGSGVCNLCPDTTIAGFIGATAATQTNRLARNGAVSTCGSGKPCPGPSASDTHFEAHTFQNGPTNACITVTLTAPVANLMSGAYTNSYDPAVVCQNYVADSGDSTTLPLALPASPTRIYSFNVRSNQTFVIVVNEVSVGAGGDYTLQVSGGDCRPVLNISRTNPNRAVLDWTTAAAGYQLESTNQLAGAPVWNAVTNIPVVINSRFTVTNNLNPSNSFFRLRK